MFEKLSRTPLSQDAVEQIKKLITSSKLSVGDKLPNENQLAEMLGVSRTTIREALITLQAEGYIEVRRGKGVFVIDKDEFDRTRFIEWFQNNEFKIQELIEARIAIEPVACQLAAERIQDRELATLEKMYQEMNAAIRNQSVEEIVKWDEKFHECILKASRNQLLFFMYSNFIPSLREYRSRAFSSPANPWLAIDAHGKILQALKDRDAGLAYQAMLDHLKESYKDITGTVNTILTGHGKGI